MTEKREAGGEWDYPLVVEEMEATGIHPIGVYCPVDLNEIFFLQIFENN